MRSSIASALFAVAAVFGGAPASAQTIEDLTAIAPFLDHCVAGGLRGQGFRAQRDVTVRVAFRRDGSLIARPVASYSMPRRGEPEQERFITAIFEAIERCAPLPFSKPLGAAIAGRIFTFRYTLTDAKDQSI